MTRSGLVAALKKEHPKLKASEIERIVSCIFDAIGHRLIHSGRAELRGFGTFATRARDARTGRNPYTGAIISIEAKRLPCFKPAKALRERLNLIDPGSCQERSASSADEE